MRQRTVEVAARERGGGDVDPRSTIAALGAELAAEIDDLTELLGAEMVHQIPELRGDHTLVAMLGASVHSNLSALVTVLSYQVEPDRVPTPVGASTYARHLAQHGVSVTALVRAYRLGQRDLLAWAMDRWQAAVDLDDDRQIDLATVAELLRITSGYIDTISERVIAEYTEEREQWLMHRDRARSELLTHLVAGDPIDLGRAETTLGYRFRQDHLGFTLWGTGSPSLAPGAAEAVGALIAATLGTRAPLLWPRDAISAQGWLPLGSDDSREPLGPEALRALTQALREHARHGIRVAFGAPGSGIEGFRATHHQARRAEQVATVPHSPTPPVTSYAQAGVRAAALLAADLTEARRLVAASLGGLAADTDRCARLRRTLLVLAEENGSLTRTAERLTVHKNTIKYRVRQATEVRGRPLDEDRWDLELALHGCEHLGAAVLTPARRQPK